MGLSKDEYIDGVFNSHDVVIVTEVWLIKEQLREVARPQWHLLSTLYPPSIRGTTYGGILIYYRHSLGTRLQILELQEISWITIIWLRLGNLVLGAAYLPPENSSYLTHWPADPLELLLAGATRMSTEHSQAGIAIFGDLNARRSRGPDTKWTPRGRLLEDTLDESWLVHATLPTHITADLRHRSCIDYLLLSPRAIQLCSHRETRPFNGLSDHAELIAHFNVNYEPPQEIEPLPHDRPPAYIPTSLDLRERFLLAINPAPADEQPTELAALDTTIANVARRRMMRAIQDLHEGSTDHEKQQARRLRNAWAQERKRNRDRRRERLALHLQTLGPKAWWRHAQMVLNKKGSAQVSVPGPQLEEHFRQLLQTEPEEIPPPPANLAPLPEFDLDFTEDEVQSAVSRLHDSAAGEDRVTSRKIKAIPVAALTQHLNYVLRSRDVPRAWRRSILVAIPKPGGDPANPNSVRGIALQSAMRKLFTSLVTRRLQEYMEARLPPTQNGFRPGRRTSDNVYALRTLHKCKCTPPHAALADKLKTVHLQERKPLYVAQLDICKAFDSVSRPSLFHRLYSHGVSGRLIECLRAAYTGTEIFVKANRRYSRAVVTNLGIPQGDPISPLMFIIYMADISLAHQDDAKLGALSIPYLALADDYTVISTTRNGLQWKLDAVVAGCRPLNLALNPAKCLFLAMGSLSAKRTIHSVTIGGSPLLRATATSINGYHLEEKRMRRGWDSDTHTLRQLKKAANTLRVIKICRHEMGLTTPLHLFQIVRTLVESQQNYARETAFDASATTVRAMIRAQKDTLRYLVGVHPKASTIVLYRDFCTLPANEQSLLTALRFYEYATRAKESNPIHHAIKVQRGI